MVSGEGGWGAGILDIYSSIAEKSDIFLIKTISLNSFLPILVQCAQVKLMSDIPRLI